MSKLLFLSLLIGFAGSAFARPINCMAHVKDELDVYLIKDFAVCDLDSQLKIQKYLDQHLDLARADVRMASMMEVPQGFSRSMLEGEQLARLANIREAILRINLLLNK